MLHQVADGVHVHQSAFIRSNTVVVEGAHGVLLVDPGITADELADLAHDLRERSRPVVAGFSTHPDWDHVLWHPDLGDAPRYGTALGAETMAAFLAQPDWRSQLVPFLPPEYADEIPVEGLGAITALPDGADRLPWDGPEARVLEHRGHAAGHAALLLPEARVLIAGDMLSDLLMPFLDLSADDPLGDYSAALDLFDSIAGGVEVVVPGHGNVGDARALRERLDLDRAYVRALAAGETPDDPRIGPDAPVDWLPAVNEWQVQRLAQRD
ncbi:MBL fold metallo-hydrolase [Leifsonia sp. F6_8S_P_1B]|uniref:MBL fold metallo-hydrolase n=1 Tax=Leifsonia williamsii TaxID=3035919 RepID=A0ABT8KG47_9MICO|nr:MBL fold metallo-hydrolase [Leifsonia williamsii]MDN4615314.1 MBL fold metallo-hydrolase [Leifsonia williamsii]